MQKLVSANWSCHLILSVKLYHTNHSLSRFLEAERTWNGRDNFADLKPVKDGRLSSAIKAKD